MWYVCAYECVLRACLSVCLCVVVGLALCQLCSGELWVSMCSSTNVLQVVHGLLFRCCMQFRRGRGECAVSFVTQLSAELFCGKAHSNNRPAVRPTSIRGWGRCQMPVSRVRVRVSSSSSSSSRRRRRAGIQALPDADAAAIGSVHTPQQWHRATRTSHLYSPARALDAGQIPTKPRR